MFREYCNAGKVEINICVEGSRFYRNVWNWLRSDAVS